MLDVSMHKLWPWQRKLAVASGARCALCVELMSLAVCLKTKDGSLLYSGRNCGI